MKLGILSRPVAGLVALYTVYNANNFDDVKFITILLSVLSVIVVDLLKEEKKLDETVEHVVTTLGEKIDGDD